MFLGHPVIQPVNSIFRFKILKVYEPSGCKDKGSRKFEFVQSINSFVTLFAIKKDFNRRNTSNIIYRYI